MKDPNEAAAGAVTLDHTGNFVPDADAARAALTDLGFTVTPLSAQVVPDPETGHDRLTGTGNICVMLPEGYLEFLVHTADTAIGREFMDALGRRAGLHLAAFGTADAAARHAELTAQGVAMRPLVHFSREVDTQDGRTTAAFIVARMAAGTMPEGRVQTLTHHNIAAMWQPRWTYHANGARALRALIVSAPDPAEAAARFGRFLGRKAQPFDGGLRLTLDRGAIDFLPEDAATAIVGTAVDPGRPCFVGLRIAATGLDALRARRGAREIGTAIALPFSPALGSGIWLFEPV
ncbi:MAG: VOC family protein [Gemmobacter sp.]|nr:VOC family protein [Gemmobacter sp.]